MAKLDSTGTDIPAGKTDEHARASATGPLNVHNEIELAHVAVADLKTRAKRTNEMYQYSRLDSIASRLYRIEEHIDDLERDRGQPSLDTASGIAQAHKAVVDGKIAETEDKMDFNENAARTMKSVEGKLGQCIEELKAGRAGR